MGRDRGNILDFLWGDYIPEREGGREEGREGGRISTHPTRKVDLGDSVTASLGIDACASYAQLATVLNQHLRFPPQNMKTFLTY